MNKRREQLCPPWLCGAIGLVVALALVAAYPRDDIQVRSLASHSPSELSIAYLEAWLRIEPDSPEYLSSLALQYMKLGHWGDALGVANRLAAVGDDEPIRRQALLIQIGASEQLAYALPADDPVRDARIDEVRDLLQQTRLLDWNVAEMQLLVQKARALGIEPLVTDYYRKLALADQGNSAAWETRLAEAALAQQRYSDAARAYFAAYSNAGGLDEKRMYFLAALKVLVSGNDIARACSEGAERIGELINDPETLRYVITLARQAQRTDLVVRYARALMALTTGTPVEAPVKTAIPALPRGPVSYRGDPWLPLRGGFRKVALSAPAGGAEANFDLIYNAFVESGELEDARKIARKALEAGYEPALWSERLAQVAEWNNQPEEALQGWTLHARATHEDESWKKVLDLAAELDEDAAWLGAWRALQGPASHPDPDQGLEAMTIAYMEIGHWASALRAVEQLRGRGDEAARQRRLLLEVTAAEHRAYEFEDDDPRRRKGLDHFRSLLSETFDYQWEIPAMAWFAQKATEVGDHSVQLHYYRMLASLDSDHAATWQERLGDAELGREAYEEAALAYFAARAASRDTDAQRRYFIKGLDAYVAGDKVDKACAEAEERVGDLVQDPETLRYLINLARQSSRRDLMARYARELVKVSSHSRVETPAPAYRVGWHGARAFHAVLRPGMDVQRRLIANGIPAEPDETSETDFDVAFQAFTESRQLDEAEDVARRALEAGMDAAVWAPRLAQIAEWNGHPDTALQYWLKDARSTGSEAAWSAVLRLAPQLDDHRAYLAGLQHAIALAPSDTGLLDELVNTYEKLGEAEAGLSYLRARAHGARRTMMLERYALLARRSGHDDAAREAYEQLARESEGDPRYVLELAELEFARGNWDASLDLLQHSAQRAGTGPASAPFWRVYAELARQTHRSEDAHFAYRKLLETGQATADDLSAIGYFYQAFPLDAGRAAELQFRKSSSLAALQAAISAYNEARAWDRIDVLLGGLNAEQRDLIERSPGLLVARGQYYLDSGRREAGLRDMERAISLPQAGESEQIAYLSALTNFGSDEQLEAALSRWRHDAEIDPAHRNIYAAAALRLGKPGEALQYLRQDMDTGDDDPLRLLALADATRAAGRTEEARAIRKRAWLILERRAQAGELVDNHESALFLGRSPEMDELKAARISLSQEFAGGDTTRALLEEFLKEEYRSPEDRARMDSILADAPGLPALNRVLGPDGVTREQISISDPVLSEQGKSAGLVWATGRHEPALQESWLNRHYPDAAQQPGDVRVALALQNQDQTTLNELLDDPGVRMTGESRREALLHTARWTEAQSLVYRAGEGAPDSDETYEAMSDVLMQDRPAAGGDIVFGNAKPLQYLESILMAETKLTNRIGAGLEVVERWQRSNAEDELAWVPRHDGEIRYTMRDVTPDRALSMTLGYRKALDSFFTLDAQAQLNRRGAVTATFRAGLNQFTTLSPQMQVGAVKDMAEINVQWNPESRWYMQGSVEAARYRAQDRTYMGRGVEISGELGYRISLSQPQWTASLIATRGMYSASDNEVPLLERLVPGGGVPEASVFMPSNFTQIGGLIGFGADEKNRYSRPWRPFFNAGYVHDNNQGWGPVAIAGIGGSVIGRDRLRLFFSHQAAPQGGGHSSTRAGLSYRLFF